jgi:hypothetical protein
MTSPDPTRIQQTWQEDTEASLCRAAAQLRELVEGLDLQQLREKLESDPVNYVRVVLALAKLNDSGIKLEEARSKANREQRETHASQGGQGGLSPELLETIERELNLF